MTRRTLRLAATMLAPAAVLAVAAGTASAAQTVIYNHIPSTLPGNLQSQSFEASATSEYGSQVGFVPGTWKNPTVTVTMSTWACFEGTWNGGNCKTPMGAKFEWPITVSVYEESFGDVGPLLARASKTFKLLYRPSASVKCTGANLGKWYNKGTCFNGRAFKISLGLKIAKLPAKAIIGVAYNTSDWGAKPQRPQESGALAGCNSKPEGCPYDSLNVAETRTTATPLEPSVGEQPEPEYGYINSSYPTEYCESDVSAGTFGFTTCTEGGVYREQYVPAIEVKATAG
jgi:hypothetical protein